MLGAAGQLGGDLVDEGVRQGHEMTGSHPVGLRHHRRAAVERAIATARPDAVINGARVDAGRCGRGARGGGGGGERHRRRARGLRLRRGRRPLLPREHRLRLRRHRDVAHPRGGRCRRPGPPTGAPSGTARSRFASGALTTSSCAPAGSTAARAPTSCSRCCASPPNVRRCGWSADQRGAPTWTGHLAPAMLRLLEIGPPGTYHLTNSGVTTWHGLAVAVDQGARARGRGRADNYRGVPDRGGARPPYSVLDNRRLARARRAPAPRLGGGAARLPVELSTPADPPGQSSACGVRLVRLSAVT